MKNYKYFKASFTECSTYESNKTCTSCKKNRDIVKVYIDKEDKYLCEECLSINRVRFTHSTEIGYVERKGLIDFYTLDSINLPKGFKNEYINELQRTPNYPSLQEENWLTCCNDFMSYLGIWNPKDFRSHSLNGGKLYDSMTDKSLENLWKLSVEELGKDFQKWAITYARYYAFECVHCLNKRGYWDY